LNKPRDVSSSCHASNKAFQPPNHPFTFSSQPLQPRAAAWLKLKEDVGF